MGGGPGEAYGPSSSVTKPRGAFQGVPEGKGAPASHTMCHSALH